MTFPLGSPSCTRLVSTTHGRNASGDFHGRVQLGAPRGDRAFTLIEVLVSVMIFMVISIVLIMTLSMAGTLFREGSASRAANDEAIAVLGRIEDDLKYLLPESQGGWIGSLVQNDGTGNCRLAFVITEPDRSVITDAGVGSRRLVIWEARNDNLYRAELPFESGIEDTQKAIAETAINLTIGEQITSGCLHFGTWLAIVAPPVAAGQPHSAFWPQGGLSTDNRWDLGDVSTAMSVLPPWGDEKYSSGVPAGAAATTIPVPFPSAIHLSLCLTGGSMYAPKGRVIADNGGSIIRVTGINALPTLSGNLVRVEKEWVRISGFSNNIMTITTPNADRAQLRTSLATHPRDANVQSGRFYSLVRSLP